MAFIHDLSTETYCPWAHTGIHALSVGWLGDYIPHLGTVPEAALRVLRYYNDHHSYADNELGYHTCEICGAANFHGEFWIEIGAVRYVLPVGVFHYIAAHSYCPPQEFIDTIIPIATDLPDEPIRNA